MSKNRNRFSYFAVQLFLLFFLTSLLTGATKWVVSYIDMSYHISKCSYRWYNWCRVQTSTDKLENGQFLKECSFFFFFYYTIFSFLFFFFWLKFLLGPWNILFFSFFSFFFLYWFFILLLPFFLPFLFWFSSFFPLSEAAIRPLFFFFFLFFLGSCLLGRSPFLLALYLFLAFFLFNLFLHLEDQRASWSSDRSAVLRRAGIDRPSGLGFV